MQTPKEQLAALRAQLDTVTATLTESFNERQRISAEIAVVKANGNIAITDDVRERKVVETAVKSATPGNESATAAFVRTLIA
ncbi:MAG: chorismate mutase, partial [Oscillospiraceae bacterium]|nr:chorismate mutase [Oscillospiraceae bacterium]